MINLTRVIATVLFVAWAVGFFGFHERKEIHLLLAGAIIAISVSIKRQTLYYSKPRWSGRILKIWKGIGTLWKEILN